MRIQERRKDGKEDADIAQIKEIIPHRYPFLLIDKIIEID